MFFLFLPYLCDLFRKKNQNQSYLPESPQPCAIEENDRHSMKSLRYILVLALALSKAQADFSDLEQAAIREGKLNTLTMPDPWANWAETWQDLEKKYQIKHQDTDMTSGQAISKMRAEGKNATADLSDVGFEFAPIAKSQGVTQPYKPKTWDEIPDWAKDSEGHWMLSYTGTISFIIDKNAVKKSPRSWKELLNGKYRVAIGEVGSGSQPTNGVLAAAIALGGSEHDISPGIQFFSRLAKEQRLSLANPVISNLEKGEVEIGILWDFNALNYRTLINPERFEVLIPSDGSVISGYSTLINKHAKNPNAAKLAREYILSDAGQINLAKGYARPIRNIPLPGAIQKKLLPSEQYQKARSVKDHSAWRRSARKLPTLWQEEVMIHMQ